LQEATSSTTTTATATATTKGKTKIRIIHEKERYFASTLSLNFRIFVKNKNSFLKRKKSFNEND
jgi:hypothetical protein